MYNIEVQETPNPQVLKFVFNDQLTENAVEFDHADSARNVSPLAYQLLSFPWVKKVFIGKNFISITKEDWVEWDPLKDPLIQMMKVKSKEDILRSDKGEYKDSTRDLTGMETEGEGKLAHKITHKIKDILDKEIQPAVQMDGGFIQFDHYKDGRVYLKMKGACSGCPSAEWTLKQGIEDRLKREIPQILEVISI